jgi:hypothetical protein
MKRVYCFFFGHKWIKKHIKITIDGTTPALKQCVNCGKLKHYE